MISAVHVCFALLDKDLYGKNNVSNLHGFDELKWESYAQLVTIKPTFPLSKLEAYSSLFDQWLSHCNLVFYK